MLNEGNQIHNIISSSGSRTVINYGSVTDFLTSYGSGSGSTRQKVTVPTVPVPVPQHCQQQPDPHFVDFLNSLFFWNIWFLSKYSLQFANRYSFASKNKKRFDWQRISALFLSVFYGFALMHIK
jgi:hypothetical protein